MTKEIWDIVQDIRKHKKRRSNMEEQDMFSGLVKCIDCGEVMTLHSAHYNGKGRQLDLLSASTNTHDS